MLTNAREALGGPGDIEVLADVEPTGTNGAGVLNLLVRDSGRGMSEEFIRTSLFRPFATTKSTGLGVGLSQCKAIVEAHGGTIAVTSQPGRGTIFLLRIPVVEVTKGEDPAGTRRTPADELSRVTEPVARMGGETGR